MICNIIFIILNICTFDNIVKKKHFGAARREIWGEKKRDGIRGKSMTKKNKNSHILVSKKYFYVYILIKGKKDTLYN